MSGELSGEYLVFLWGIFWRNLLTGKCLDELSGWMGVCWIPVQDYKPRLIPTVI